MVRSTDEMVNVQLRVAVKAAMAAADLRDLAQLRDRLALRGMNVSYARVRRVMTGETQRTSADLLAALEQFCDDCEISRDPEPPVEASRAAGVEPTDGAAEVAVDEPPLPAENEAGAAVPGGDRAAGAATSSVDQPPDADGDVLADLRAGDFHTSRQRSALDTLRQLLSRPDARISHDELAGIALLLHNEGLDVSVLPWLQ